MVKQTRIDALVRQEQVAQLSFQELGDLGYFAKFPVDLIQRRHLRLVLSEFSIRIDFVPSSPRQQRQQLDRESSSRQFFGGCQIPCDDDALCAPTA